MESYFPDLWIERKDRKKCLAYTASATGIRIKYADGLDSSVIDNINALISFLRNRFFFPVRCNIYITKHKRYRSQEDNRIYYGIFYDNANLYEKKIVYPQIFIAAGLHKHLTIEDVMFTLLHELTHYYQWFFAEEKGRSNRSIESEATKWANWILSDFMEAQTIKTPFGALNIYVDDKIINYLPVITRFEHPTCEGRPLTACYRISGKLKGKHSVKCVIEPITSCKIYADSGENYLCQNFIKDSVQLTIGTVDYFDVEPLPYDVNLISNGFIFTNLTEKVTVELRVAWVNNRSEDDLRTWFAADPS